MKVWKLRKSDMKTDCFGQFRISEKYLTNGHWMIARQSDERLISADTIRALYGIEVSELPEDSVKRVLPDISGKGFDCRRTSILADKRDQLARAYRDVSTGTLVWFREDYLRIILDPEALIGKDENSSFGTPDGEAILMPYRVELPTWITVEPATPAKKKAS